MKNFKTKVAQISLEVGGSHYPSVNTDLQQQMVKMILDQCLNAVESCDRNHVRTTFDLAQHQTTVEHAKAAIKESFGL